MTKPEFALVWSVYGHRKRVGKKGSFLSTVEWKTPHSTTSAKRRASQTFPQFTITHVEPEAYVGWWQK